MEQGREYGYGRENIIPRNYGRQRHYDVIQSERPLLAKKNEKKNEKKEKNPAPINEELRHNCIISFCLITRGRLRRWEGDTRRGSPCRTFVPP